MASVPPSDASIRRRLRRKGLSTFPRNIASYLRGWHQMDRVRDPVEPKPKQETKQCKKKSKPKKTKSASR